MYFHSKVFSFPVQKSMGWLYFHLFLLPQAENHKKVTGINKRQTRPFSSLHSSARVAEGPADLRIIVKAS